MPQIRADRVLEISTVEGTGDITLAGAVVGYRAFSSVLSNGDTAYYMIQAVTSVGAPSGPWELGLGTYVAATNRLQRSPILSSNGNALVSFAGGQKQIWLAYTAADYAALVAADTSEASTRAAADTTLNNRVTSEVATLNTTLTNTVDAQRVVIDVYDASATWTKRTNAKWIHAVAVGAGGGGAAGGRVDTLNTVYGGGGGGGGAIWSIDIPASQLPGTVSVTVGLGGSGGASWPGGSGTQSPRAGTAGGNSSFGTYLFAPGGAGAIDSSGGTGGISIAPNSGATGGTGANPTPGAQALFASGGGGGGGRGSTTTAGGAGGAGWIAQSSYTAGTGGGGAAGSNPAGAGGPGTSRSGTGYGGDGGGGGGSRANAGTAGAGGAGGAPGGGGGGGGAANGSASAASGAGGNGGQGEVIVITWF